MNQAITNNTHQESTTSSISEYLIETLPGWHVEDFLDPPTNFSKVGHDKDPGPIWGGDLTDRGLNSSLASPMGIWVPQAPPHSRYAHVLPQFEPRSNMGFGDQTINGSSLVFAQNDYNNINKIENSTKISRNRVPDNGHCFTVPQISPSSTSLKRSRTVWQ